MRRCLNSSWRPSGAASRAVSWVDWKAGIDRLAGMLCGRRCSAPTMGCARAGQKAGACSMALGEWVSVASSRELAQREIRIESSELAEDPEGEGEELKLIYEAKGLSSGEADTMVHHLLTDRATALDALAREELGIEPSELGGSAWEAAASSFVLFSVGAIVPILPYLVTRGNTAVVSSGAVSGLALFAIGAAITLFTGMPVWRSGGRQLLLGLAAARVTFRLGKLIGTAITG